MPVTAAEHGQHDRPDREVIDPTCVSFVGIERTYP